MTHAWDGKGERPDGFAGPRYTARELSLMDSRDRLRALADALDNAADHTHGAVRALLGGDEPYSGWSSIARAEVSRVCPEVAALLERQGFLG